MLCGVTRILSRIKWWFFGPKQKFCKSCCMRCPYYNECKAEVEEIERIFGEIFE